MKKRAFLNMIFDPALAPRIEEHYAYLRDNGYEWELYPEFSTIRDEALLIEKLRDADVYIGAGIPYTARIMDACPRCRAICRTGVGYDSIDVAAATQRGIAVAITPGVSAEAVAEYAFSLMAAAARRVVEIDRTVRSGRWERLVGCSLWHKTLGIVGLGRIGKKLARIAQGFDMQVLAYDQFHDEAFAAANRITYFDSLDEMLERCDFVSIHTNLSETTRGLIAKPQLMRMKPTAVLVNAARGGVLVEADLCEALCSGQIAAAALDVYEREPLAPDHPLRQAPHLILSTHNADSSFEAKDALLQAAFHNAVALGRGETPEGLVNPDCLLHRG